MAEEIPGHVALLAAAFFAAPDRSPAQIANEDEIYDVTKEAARLVGLNFPLDIWPDAKLFAAARAGINALEAKYLGKKGGAA